MRINICSIVLIYVKEMPKIALAGTIFMTSNSQIAIRDANPAAFEELARLLLVSRYAAAVALNCGLPPDWQHGACHLPLVILPAGGVCAVHKRDYNAH